MSDDEKRRHAMQDQKYDPDVFFHNLQNFELRKVPCAVESLSQGAMIGGTVGMIRFVRTRYIASALSWTIGSFLFSSVASLEYCRYNRRQQEDRIEETVAAMNRYQASKASKALPYVQDRDVSTK